MPFSTFGTCTEIDYLSQVERYTEWENKTEQMTVATMNARPAAAT